MWPVLEYMFKIHFGISLVWFRSCWSFPPGYLTVLQPFAVLALFVGVAFQQAFHVLILLEKQSCQVDLDEYYFLLHHKARLRKLVGPCLGACGEIVALRLPLGCTHWNIWNSSSQIDIAQEKEAGWSRSMNIPTCKISTPPPTSSCSDTPLHFLLSCKFSFLFRTTVCCTAWLQIATNFSLTKEWISKVSF